MNWEIRRRNVKPRSPIAVPALPLPGDTMLTPDRTDEAQVGAAPAANDVLLGIKVDIHRELLDRVNLAAIEKLSRTDLVRELSDIIGGILTERNIALNRVEREDLVEDIVDELVGLGPLEPLIKDDSISDILVNGYETVFVERGGKLDRKSVV